MYMVIRTCLGCRQRVDKSTLVRVVARKAAGRWSAEPDLTGSMPGRGAHLHLSPECLEQASRRRAFARALRVEGPVDIARLTAVVLDRGSRST